VGYPQKLLGQNERIEFEMRPHWRSLILPILVVIVILPVTIFLVTLLDSDGAQGILRWVVIAIAVLILLIWAVKPFLDWLTTQYAFTNRRIIVRSGLITRKGKDMPLAKVNNVAFEKTLIERILNCGTLVIESAAESGALVIANVPDVEDIQREVYRLHEADVSRRRGVVLDPDE
jgi:uncharacterized membrane protein YdbT with pleckstrin-like domain